MDAYILKLLSGAAVAANGTISSDYTRVSAKRKATLFLSAAGNADAKFQASPDERATWFDLSTASGMNVATSGISLEGITDVRVSVTDTSAAANTVNVWLGLQ
jgi:hypothetical protein